MTRNIPIIPTIIVAAAIAVMIALGFWQLGRMDEKEALIAQAERSLKMSSEVEYPRDEAGIEAAMYRRTTILCASASAARQLPGPVPAVKRAWRSACSVIWRTARP